MEKQTESTSDLEQEGSQRLAKETGIGNSDNRWQQSGISRMLWVLAFWTLNMLI